MRSKKAMALLLTGAALLGMTAAGCGSRINDDAVFATLDDTTISMGVANFFAKYEQSMYDSVYLTYFGEDMWNNDLYGSGNTLAQDVKEDIADNIRTMYLLKAHMEEYGISISEEEEAAMAKAADDFIAANSKEAIKQVGAENKENVIEMLRLSTIQQKMHDRIIEDADAEVTDEEAAQRTFSYVSINTDSRVDSESNTIEYTDEEKAALKETAETISKAEDFEKAVEDAGYTVSTMSYGSAEDEDATMDTAVLTAADALKEGEVSDVIETENACYVVRLDSEHDEEATASKKESMISQKQEDYYNDILDGWKEAAKWTINESEWEKVTFDSCRFASIQEETETGSGEESGTESVSGTESTEEDGAESTQAATESSQEASSEGTETE